MKNQSQLKIPGKQNKEEEGQLDIWKGFKVNDIDTSKKFY